MSAIKQTTSKMFLMIWHVLLLRPLLCRVEHLAMVIGRNINSILGGSSLVPYLTTHHLHHVISKSRPLLIGCQFRIRSPQSGA